MQQQRPVPIPIPIPVPALPPPLPTLSFTSHHSSLLQSHPIPPLPPVNSFSLPTLWKSMHEIGKGKRKLIEDNYLDQCKWLSEEIKVLEKKFNVSVNIIESAAIQKQTAKINSDASLLLFILSNLTSFSVCLFR